MDFFRKFRDLGRLVTDTLAGSPPPNPVQEILGKGYGPYPYLVEFVAEHHADPRLAGWLDEALRSEEDFATVQFLLRHGASPDLVSSHGRKCLLGHEDCGDEEFDGVTPAMFEDARSPSFGTTNPEQRTPPYWRAMVRTRNDASFARRRYGIPSADSGGGQGPIWCAERLGQTLTFLPDGRVVETGGRHGDQDDPDFYVYNDVFVHGPDGSLAVYCYPVEAFPPTDFHSATLVGAELVLIGNLGHQDGDGADDDLVHVLSTSDFSVRPQPTMGDGPGLVCGHRARLLDDGRIEVKGGMLSRSRTDNPHTHILNPRSFVWTKAD